MILYYIIILATSLLLSLFASYYQHCYRTQIDFTPQKAFTCLRNSLIPFILFACLYEGISVFLIFFYQKMNINVMMLPQYILFWEGLMLAAWIDFKTKKIPNPIFLLLLAIRCIGIVMEMAFFTDQIFSILLDSFAGLIAGAMIVLICRLLSRGGIGAGDVKLFGILGFYFGLIATMNVLFYTTFISAISAAFLLITKKASMKSTLAFGPFAFIGVNIYYILLSLS